MLDRIRRLIVGKIRIPEQPALDEHERRIDEDLARVSHQTPEAIRRDVRRRALRIEVDSMRRQ